MKVVKKIKQPAERAPVKNETSQVPGQPVLVTLTRQGDGEGCARACSTETSEPLEAQLANLFEPFKRESADNQRNRNGPRYRPVHLPGHRPGPPGTYRRGLPRRRHHPFCLRLPVRQAETGSSSDDEDRNANACRYLRQPSPSGRIAPFMPRLRLRTVLACLAVFCATPHWPGSKCIRCNPTRAWGEC